MKPVKRRMKNLTFKIYNSADKSDKQYTLAIPIEESQLKHTSIEILNTLCEWSVYLQNFYEIDHKRKPTDFFGTPEYQIAAMVRDIIKEANIYRTWKAKVEEYQPKPQTVNDSPYPASPSNTVNRTNPQPEAPPPPPIDHKHYQLIDYQLIEV